MLGMWLTVRKMRAMTLETKQRVDPLLQSAVEIVSNAREPLRTIIENLSETTKMVRQRTTEVDVLVADVVDKSKTHITRIDQMLGERTTEAVNALVADFVEKTRGEVSQIDELLRHRTTDVDALVGDLVEKSRTQVSRADQILRDQMGSLDSMMSDGIQNSRAQLERLDHLVSDVVRKIETTSELMQRGALAPITEVSAVVKGVRAGLQFFFSRQKTNGAETGGQDEQLFI